MVSTLIGSGWKTVLFHQAKLLVKHCGGWRWCCKVPGAKPGFGRETRYQGRSSGGTGPTQTLRHEEEVSRDGRQVLFSAKLDRGLRV